MTSSGDAYARAKRYSCAKLSGMRDALRSFEQSIDSVVTFGSYARREASAQSDIDYVLIEKEPGACTALLQSEIAATIKRFVPVESAKDGTFGTIVPKDEFVTNIGGSNDTNEALTRRILLLLEGDYLIDQGNFEKLRSSVLNNYVPETLKDHHLTLFLLNDIIRYWRTITVDYQFKIQFGGKPWAIRNIKLVFSRKLMYASGVFGVALTTDKSVAEKRKILTELFDVPVAERMASICGAERVARLLGIYDDFLAKLEQQDVRETLNAIEDENHSNRVYRELKNQSYQFNRELLLLMENVFHASHPIHRALIY